MNANENEPCELCDDTYMIECDVCGGTGEDEDYAECDSCMGEGEIDCPECS
jgi:RecJ-like exonuclease